MAMNSRSFWRKKRIWLFVAILLLPFLSVFVITRSIVLSPIIGVALKSEFGTEVRVRGAVWNWDSTVSIREVTLRAKGIDGLAADVIAIHDVTLEFSSSVPIFDSEIISLDIDEIRVRLAESTKHAGQFNFSRLFTMEDDLSSSSESGDSNQLSIAPHVSLQKLVVETGVMQGGKWTMDSSKEFLITNTIHEEEKTSLILVDENDKLNINLQIISDPLQVLAEIKDVQLDNTIFKLLPRTARTWCEETQLHGGIKTLDISWDTESGARITATVEDLKFQLPEEHGVPWAAYRNGEVKRIHGDAALDVKHGVIMYDDQSVFLKEIRGYLVPPQQAHSEPLEFSAEMKIYNFESVGKKQGKEWMDTMLSESPFDATFTIKDFSPNQSEAGKTAVPLAAAQMLKLFQLKDWKMNAKVSVSRPERGEDVEVKGDLIIDGASGMYKGFPYPLREITSHIKFERDETKILFLNALGSGEAKVHINGTVKTEAEFLYVDLNLNAEDAPLDQKLRDALSDQIGSIMDHMIDYEAFERIEDSLVVKDGKKFQIGGTIDLDLRIVHDERQSTGIVLSGDFKFEDIGIVHGDFPYPVVLKSGVVILDSQGLHIPEDEIIKFEGAGGGKGNLAGSILFSDDDITIPVLAIELENEWLTATLVGAVSDAAGESYKLAASFLGGLGLSSMLQLEGSIVGDAEGELNTSFAIKILDGTAMPNERLAKAIQARGPFWPEGFKFTNVVAEIIVDNGVVSASGVTCQCGEGSLVASMTIDKGELDLLIRGEDIPFSSRFADVLPNGASEKLSNAWVWLNPSGVMDVEIRMAHLDQDSKLYMEVKPKELVVTTKDRNNMLQWTNGNIVVEGTNVFFNELNFELHEKGQKHGELEINGEVHGMEETFGYSLDATWDELTFDSPLARAITGIVGGQGGVDLYDKIEPSGNANAILTARGEDEETSYAINIIPNSMSAMFHERRAVAVFDGGESNQITFDNAGMHFDSLGGTLGEGDFLLNGLIVSGEAVKGKFDLTWSGPTGDESLYAVLPKVVGDTLLAIEIKDGTSVLPNGLVSFFGDSWDSLLVAFEGDIELDDVSINVGIPLTDINGAVHINGRYSKEHLSALELSMNFDELTTIGRIITDVAGSLEFDSVKDRFEFNQMRGESATGGVTVEGWIALDDSKIYEIEVLIAGVALETKDSDKLVASLRGDLNGWLSIAGIRGESDSRRGVGKIKVDNGHLEINPLSLSAMKVLQLALPTSSSIEGADIDLYIVGDQIILENIILRSGAEDISAFVLEGDGSIDFESFEIQARLHPRAGLPIIRDIAGAVNDQLYSIDVTGKLLDPQVSVVPLPFLSPQ